MEGPEGSRGEKRERAQDLWGEGLPIADPGPSLTDLESAIYDRQIRVWGTDVQRRLSGARILVIGITGVVAETCKNIVLAGVGNVSLLDKRPVTPENSSSNLLVTSEDLENSRQPLDSVCALALRDFNPMVNVSVVQGEWKDQRRDFLQNFDVVILGKSSISFQKEVNEKCREGKNKICFFYVDSCGYFSKIFVDLNQHSYKLKDKTKQEHMVYPSFNDVLRIPISKYIKSHPLLAAFQVIQTLEDSEILNEDGTDEIIEKVFKHLKDINLSYDGTPPTFTKHVNEILCSRTEEFTPSCAIVGGVLAQEVIRSASCHGKPLRNFFVFDATTCVGTQILVS